jgi:hypothetical protein
MTCVHNNPDSQGNMQNAHCGHLLSMGTPVLRFLQVTGGELDNPGAVYALHCLHRVRAGF